MNNTALKLKIERAANVEIQISGYRKEGYVYAYPIGSGEMIGSKMYWPGVKPIASQDSYGQKTTAQANRVALLKLAATLGVNLSDDDKNAAARANQADFDARTRR